MGSEKENLEKESYHRHSQCRRGCSRYQRGCTSHGQEEEAAGKKPDVEEKDGRRHDSKPGRERAISGRGGKEGDEIVEKEEQKRKCACVTCRSCYFQLLSWQTACK